MTSHRALTPQPEAPRPSLPLADLVERTRRSIVLVRAGASSGTGWPAMDTGLIVTAHSIVGRHAHATIELDDGTKRSARVVHCDIGADAAFLLAEGAPSPPALRRATRPGRLGQPVWALACVADEGLVIHQGVISAVERVRHGRPVLGVSFTLRGSGAPLFDMDGRVVGVFGRAGSKGLVTPIDRLEAQLAELDRPASELTDRRPAYRCPACNVELAPSLDRCLGCGAVAPDAYDLVHAGAERTVREGLSALGAAAAHAPSGPGAWRVVFASSTAPTPAVAIDLRIDATGSRWMASARVSPVPRADHEPFYRLLLSLNDETTEPFRLGIEGSNVILCATSPLPSVIDRDLVELARHVEHYRKVLDDAFDPTRSTSSEPR
jgi:hypothetical protein